MYTTQRLARHLRPMILLICIFFGLLSVAWALEPWKVLPLPPPMPTASRIGYVPVNGIQMYFAVYGTGSPVILLHGGLGNSDYWSNQIPALAQRHQVIVVDSRGHGRSTRTAQPFSYALMASDVLGLMDYLHLRRASIVGWSDGGIIGLEIAIHHPERLERLFAFGANFNTEGLITDIGDSPTDTAYSQKARQDYALLSPTPGSFDDFLAAMLVMWTSQPNFQPAELKSIERPVMISDGDHDEYIKLSHTRQLANLIPGAQLALIPQASHFAIWQRPDLVNRLILDFLYFGQHPSMPWIQPGLHPAQPHPPTPGSGKP